MLIAATVLMFTFIPAKGTIPDRSGWIDMTVTMIFAALLGFGAV
jgi:hypothetical protein